MTSLIYGPFLSRRLGLSLGLNLLGDKKKCTFNCVYCEIGRSSPRELVPVGFKHECHYDLVNLKKELINTLKNLPEIDSVTFGYMGETTLAMNLNTILGLVQSIKNSLKNLNHFKLSIFTNSSTLGDPKIRKILSNFDLIMAKLDTGNQKYFKEINRPHESVPNIEEIIENIKTLRDELKYKQGATLAIQTLMFNSKNHIRLATTDQENLKSLAKAFDYINPDFIQLYPVARQPAEQHVLSLKPIEKEKIKTIIQKIMKKKIKMIFY
ncbi:MAG: radical SAM protein [Promethearchaeota archaeon]